MWRVSPARDRPGTYANPCGSDPKPPGTSDNRCAPADVAQPDGCWEIRCDRGRRTEFRRGPGRRWREPTGAQRRRLAHVSRGEARTRARPLPCCANGGATPVPVSTELGPMALRARRHHPGQRFSIPAQRQPLRHRRGATAAGLRPPQADSRRPLPSWSRPDNPDYAGGPRPAARFARSLLNSGKAPRPTSNAGLETKTTIAAGAPRSATWVRLSHDSRTKAVLNHWYGIEVDSARVGRRGIVGDPI